MASLWERRFVLASNATSAGVAAGFAWAIPDEAIREDWLWGPTVTFELAPLLTPEQEEALQHWAVFVVDWDGPHPGSWPRFFEHTLTGTSHANLVASPKSWRPSTAPRFLVHDFPTLDSTLFFAVFATSSKPIAFDVAFRVLNYTLKVEGTDKPSASQQEFLGRTKEPPVNMTPIGRAEGVRFSYHEERNYLYGTNYHGFARHTPDLRISRNLPPAETRPYATLQAFTINAESPFSRGYTYTEMRYYTDVGVGNVSIDVNVFGEKKKAAGPFAYQVGGTGPFMDISYAGEGPSSLHVSVTRASANALGEHFWLSRLDVNATMKDLLGLRDPKYVRTP